MSTTKADPNSLEAKVKHWVNGFLHSPATYDGKSAEDIIKADIEESRDILKRELPKRKASDSMKVFRTKDELELKYWFIQKPNNKKVKILVHGSGANFAKAARAVSLLDRGFNVAMISYRGHSGNPGKADQKTIINDVMGTILEIMSLGYLMEDVYLEGSSLGTSVLAHALKRIYQESGTGSQFAGLLLKAAPLNLNDRDEDTEKSLKASGIDPKRAQPYLKKLWNQEDAYSKILAREIKIVHGTRDDVVPVEHAQKIKDMLDRNNSNVSLHIINGEGHRLDLNQYGIY
jgi:pimeloyl-ACP methyl ester carboxylesterase